MGQRNKNKGPHIVPAEKSTFEGKVVCLKKIQIMLCRFIFLHHSATCSLRIQPPLRLCHMPQNRVLRRDTTPPPPPPLFLGFLRNRFIGFFFLGEGGRVTQNPPKRCYKRVYPARPIPKWVLSHMGYYIIYGDAC